jgi:hypothetical protein
MHLAFRIPYMDDYVIKLCKQEAQVIQKHENVHIPNIGQGEARHRKDVGLILGCDRLCGLVVRVLGYRPGGLG